MFKNSFSLDSVLSTAQVVVPSKTFHFNGRAITLRQEQGVCGAGDYYTDFAAEILPHAIAELAKDRKEISAVFEAGTGRGFFLNLFATLPSVKSLYGVDVNPKAVVLTGCNLQLNGVKSFRLFAEPVSETFKLDWKVDFIVHTLPLLPLAGQELPQEIRVIVDGGKGGRKFIDFMIRNSPNHLTKGGGLFFVQPSFAKGGKEKTIRLLRENGFKPFLLGERKKPLRETILTQRLKPFIEERLGYLFPEDENGHYFTMQAFLGVREASV